MPSRFRTADARRQRLRRTRRCARPRSHRRHLQIRRFLCGRCPAHWPTRTPPQTIHFVRGRTTSAKVQIDHVVALENAWQSGAHDWSTAKRHEFGNDPYNLLAVDGPANQEKGSASAAYWLPTNADYRCDYVARQIGVKDKYQLTVTSQEKDAMLAVLHTCPGQAVPADE
ncbi:MAG: HNH endonuclease family protein [Bifidobacterium pseudocatenulatum]